MSQGKEGKGLRATLEQWQTAIDERIRTVLPNFAAFRDLETEVRRIPSDWTTSNAVCPVRHPQTGAAARVPGQGLAAAEQLRPGPRNSRVVSGIFPLLTRAGIGVPSACCTR